MGTTHTTTTPKACPETITLDFRTVQALARAAHWAVTSYEIPIEPHINEGWSPEDGAPQEKLVSIQHGLKKLMGEAEVRCYAKKVKPTTLNFVSALNELVTAQAEVTV
ncbi:MAG: hypothetical protein Q8O00_07380 [Holophaga sp.]|nr:hypothetical protein [Holophaga sp.]